MLSKIGTGELLIVFMVIVIFIGPDKLPQMAKVFGKGFRDFKSYVQSTTEDLKESSADISEVYSEIDSIKNDIADTFKDASSDIKNVISANNQKKTSI